MITRRELLTGSLLAGPALLNLRADAQDGALPRGVAVLERRYGGRLGVAVLDTARNRLITYRGHERFPLCSTHKFLSAAFVLARVDRKEESLARRVVYAREALVSYSPVTEKHAGKGGLTVGALCEAALTLSDNTAANLLLETFGGPAGLTAHLRSLGDGITRLDRREPELNEARPGDPRDTTTPVAMLEDMHKILLGAALSPPSRHQLDAWLVACRTGGKRLRAGVPPGWRVGDKTGSGEHNATNDIAVLWPPRHAPILVTAYYTESHASEDERNAVLSEVGHLAAATIGVFGSRSG